MTLYQALHRLKERGTHRVSGAAERSDERRKYFQLTERGRRRLRPRLGDYIRWFERAEAKAYPERA